MIDAIEAAYAAADAAKASGEAWELVEYLTGKAERMLIENARGLVAAARERDELRALLVKAGEYVKDVPWLYAEIHRATQTEAEQEAGR